MKTFRGGANAAHVTLELMRTTLKLIDPLEVIEAYNAEAGRDRIPHMWEQLGGRTIRTIANGSRTLAVIWQSAWNEGKGNSVPSTQLTAINKNSLRALYSSSSFLESRWLKDM